MKYLLGLITRMTTSSLSFFFAEVEGSGWLFFLVR